MTFRTVVLKNLQSHLRKYLSCFLCSSFAIMIFFMYATLQFSDSVDQEEGLRLIFSVGLYLVFVFAVFFISYAHSVLLKSRYKEFGLYMTLGMSTRDIRKLVLFENIWINLSSLCLGLITGLLFSRLFQMIAFHLLEIENFRYTLNVQSFALTIGLFVAILFIVIIQSDFSIRKLDVAGLFQKPRKGENQGKYSKVLGIAGLLLILTACFLLFYAVDNRDLLAPNVVTPLSLALAISGMYLVIINLGNAVLQFVKKRPGLYFRTLLSATEINHRFNQNKKALFALSIVSTMIILFVCVTAGMYAQSKNITALMQPNDLEYVELGTINNMPPAEIDEIIRNANTPLINRNSIEFLSLNILNNSDISAISDSKPFISQTAFNRAVGTDIKIKTGEAVSIIVPGSQILSEYTPQMGKLELQTQAGICELLSNQVLITPWISGLSIYPSGAGMVINDEDYREIRNSLDNRQIGWYHSFNFQDWEETQSTVTQFQTALAKCNKAVPTVGSDLFSVASRIGFSEEYKRGYSFGLFIFSLIGILFLIASINVIYFKQFSELDKDKARYRQLYRIGITEKEIIQAGLPEIRIMFFVPPFLAVIPGLALIWFSNSLLGGGYLITQLMSMSIVIIGAYLLIQIMIYLVIKRAYFAQLLQSV